MEITYATGHKWSKKVVEDSLSLFGKSEQKKIAETLKKINTSDISYTIQPLDEEFFGWWLPLYEERISTKDNPKIFNVKDKTLGNPDKDKKYFSLTLLEGNIKLGGLIFSVKENTLYFAYRTFAYDWEKAILRCGPSLYVEYVVAEHAKRLGLKNISHGKDHNPYGLNSSIGLALFKLSVGCLPQLPEENFTVERLDAEKLDKDALVFEYPQESVKCASITKIYLIASLEGQNKWSQLERFSDVLDIEIITRATT